MISISQATIKDAQLLSCIGRLSFIESHGSSATAEIVEEYVTESFSLENCIKELSDLKNIYYFIYYNRQPAGYSKIILDTGHPNIKTENVTKLERLYLLKEFYHLRLGLKLTDFNIELSKQHNQKGMWVFVWKGNEQAVNFYKKTGFEAIGEYFFKLTDAHSNPNFQMFLKY